MLELNFSKILYIFPGLFNKITKFYDFCRIGNSSLVDFQGSSRTFWQQPISSRDKVNASFCIKKHNVLLPDCEISLCLPVSSFSIECHGTFQFVVKLHPTFNNAKALVKSI